MNTMYLTSEILDWGGDSQSYSGNDEQLWKRAYEIWSHAEHVLSNPTSDFLRVDAITTLKRSIDHRVRALNNLYSFRSIPIKNKPSEILNLLEFAGIVRPLMLQRLLDIRNAVEHEDMSPPDTEACQMFLEFTWYFLKSTDRLVQLVLDDFGLRPLNDDNTYYWLNVRSGPKHNWLPKLTGWVTPEMLSTDPKDKWLAINVEKTETRKELTARLKGTSAAVKKGDRGRGKNPDDIFIHAEVRGPSDALIKLLRMYFEAG